MESSRFQENLPACRDILAAGNNQVSQGELKLIEYKNEPKLLEYKENEIKALSESIEAVNLEQIECNNLIDDYKDKTTSLYPILVKTPSGCFCIEGTEMVEEAKGKSESTITCHIYHVQSHSEIDLAIWKVAIRSLPSGGVATYAEIVKNVSYIFHRMLTSNESLTAYTHGGARRGEQFSNNKEDNIRSILAERLGKSRKTISTYLSHGQYLDDSTIGYLITSGATKRSFEAVQVPKRTLVKNLESEGLSQDEITKKVSERLPGMFDESSQNRKITPITEQDEQESGEIEKTFTPDTETDAPQEFRYWAGNQSEDSDGDLTFEGLVKEFKGIYKTLGEAINPVIDLEKFISIVEGQLPVQAKILSKAKTLQGGNSHG